MDGAWRAGRGAQFYRSTPPHRGFLGPIGAFIPDARTGKLRVLAISGQARSPYLFAEPEVVGFGKRFGLEIQASSPGELARLLEADAAEWRERIRQTGFTAES